MKNLKKWLLSIMCAVCAFAGVATLQNDTKVETASAAVATEYEVVDTAMMATIKNEYIPNGNFSLYIIIPELDMGGKTGQVTFPVDMAQEFNKLGLFDNIKIAGKSLREYGCTGFWGDGMSIGINEKPNDQVPHNHIRLYCHADPVIWETAYNAGEWNWSSEVTIAEGTLIPGYSYLSGAEDATLYRAGCEFVTAPSTANYGITSYGETDIVSMEYVQGHDGNSGYLGVSLKGDDYLGNGEQVEINQSYVHQYNSFIGSIELNGMKDKAKYYGLYNLGEAGKGYYSFQVSIPEGELNSITIPAGTLFPARALNNLPQMNILPSGAIGYPVIVYRTQTTQTFYRNLEGKYVSFDGYLASVQADVNATYEAKIADCFAADAEALNTAVATANAALATATTIEDIDAAYSAVKVVFNSVITKTEATTAAMAELNAYKAEEGYFRDAEKAQREGFLADAETALAGISTKDQINAIVTMTKANVDALKTAAQYADEELAGEKTAARAEISAYKANVAYLDEETTAYAVAIEAGLTAVSEAKTSEEIAAAIAMVKTTVDGLETRASIVDAAKAEVNGYKAEEGLYREAEATERASIVATAISVIESATIKVTVENAVATAIAAIDALKTDAELTAEEKAAADEALAQEKQNTLDKINEIKAAVDYNKYSTENQTAINELYKAVKNLVADALTESELSAAVATFEEELAKIPQKEVVNNDNNSDVTNDATDNADTNAGIMGQLGCASVVGVSGVTALTIALGAAALCVKKRKED